MQYIAGKLIEKENQILDGKKYLIHDRDTKFCKLFTNAFETNGITPVKLPARSPNLNAHCERFIRSLKEECINKMIFIGEKSLQNALHEYEKHYHHERNHQGLDNQLIDPGPELQIRDRPIQCHKRLGGLLKYYHRDAA